MRFRLARLILLAIFIFPFGVAVVQAGDATPRFRSTDFPLPRYVSLSADKVYARSGPALRYPIRWIYKREGLPVEIVQEFENWRKVKDFEGDSGWIHRSLLSGDRTVIILRANDNHQFIPMREGFSVDARLVARLEPRVIASVEKCTASWCRLALGGYRGWVQRKFLWGIYDREKFD